MPIPPEWNLTGRKALVVTNGLGWTPTLVQALQEAGAQVGVVAHTAEGLRGMQGLALSLRADVTDPVQVRQAVARMHQHMGRIDILVHNTQVVLGKPFLDTTIQEFDRVFQFNVRAAWLVCQEVARVMLAQRYGRMVLIASGLAERGNWNLSAYCASMAALTNLVHTLALELGRSNIRVNGIGPGWMSLEEKPLEEQQKELLVRYLPIRRYGHPRDLVGLLVYMCSEACDYLTGHTVYIDGGAMIHP
ncbi:MAG: SDR family oxidoreductase [Dehalococcoidia bacterium]|nr:SDR family oxidoreductase [Dehalococcoidia bacterium]MDW8119208.1 SDR family oxidoreductase [Chloroflexota bacterium]